MLWTELTYRLRNLLRTPLFVVVACLSLAIGFGLNAAVCAVFKNIVLRPLPFDEPDRLMTVWEANSSVGVPQISVSLGNFADLQSAHAFDTLTAFLPRASVLTSETGRKKSRGLRFPLESNLLPGFVRSLAAISCPLILRRMRRRW